MKVVKKDVRRPVEGDPTRQKTLNVEERSTTLGTKWCRGQQTRGQPRLKGKGGRKVGRLKTPTYDHLLAFSTQKTHQQVSRRDASEQSFRRGSPREAAIASPPPTKKTTKGEAFKLNKSEEYTHRNNKSGKKE